MKFVDFAKIYVKSGDGGHGHIGFHREKFVPKGGPDGGNGGKGGDVIAKVDPHMNTLLDFRYHRKYIARDGQKGGKNKCSGKSADDKIFRVPHGTLIKDAETGDIIADLNDPGSEFIVAKGGKGGKGNSEFATATRQAPRFAEDGKPGVELDIILELKIIADVGLVGFPNAGKSTLISVISAAKPKIADYPFTTLVPNIGIVKVGDYMNFSVADIPGLIEGASEGKGLGTQFLRHVERTKILVFLIESTSENPTKDYETLLNELLKFNPDMKFKKQIICFSKADIADNKQRKELADLQFADGSNSLIISSITRESIDTLKWKIWETLAEFDA